MKIDDQVETSVSSYSFLFPLSKKWHPRCEIHAKVVVMEIRNWRISLFEIPFGGLAQLVEHLICIQRVRSSSLLASSFAVIAQLVRARH